MRGQTLFQLLAAPGQPRHHCAQRNLGHRGHFFVRQTLELAQDNYLAEFDRQFFQCLADQLSIGLCCNTTGGFMASLSLLCNSSSNEVVVALCRRFFASQVLQVWRTIVNSHVARPPWNPGKNLIAQARLLHHVFRILVSRCQPAGQIICGV